MKIKSVLFSLVLFLFVGSFFISHAETTSWRLSGGTLYIEGTGAMPDYTDASQTPWYADRQHIVSISMAEGVTHIGDYAFAALPNLTGATIGSSVASIGNYAFYDNTKLLSMHIPGNVVSIGDYAFCRATAMMAVTFSEGVASIGNYAFCRCYNLKSITLPSSVTALGIHAFANCDLLKTVRIGSGVQTIGSNCFYACYSLTDITIPPNVETMGEFVFGYCSKLKNVIILCPLTTLPAGTFANSTIASVTLPGTLTAIDKRAFMYCYKLTSVAFSGNRHDWQAIRIAEDNDVLSGIAVRCLSSLHISSAAWKNNTLSVHVTIEEPTQSGVLIACVYDGEGRFVSAKKQTISATDTSASFALTAPSGGCVNVVLWNSWEHFSPLTIGDSVTY